MPHRRCASYVLQSLDCALIRMDSQADPTNHTRIIFGTLLVPKIVFVYRRQRVVLR
jgi:hypothetical protein